MLHERVGAREPIFGDGDKKMSRIKEMEHAVAQLVEVLCYKPKGRVFDSAVRLEFSKEKVVYRVRTFSGK
jgi:hypothetical protein